MDLARTLASVAVRRAARGFTFDDLARAATSEQGTIGLVADWLAHARSSGLVHEAGFDTGVAGLTGPRRYRLASRRDTQESEHVT
jgi:hypothetical protein